MASQLLSRLSTVRLLVFSQTVDIESEYSDPSDVTSAETLVTVFRATSAIGAAFDLFLAGKSVCPTIATAEGSYHLRYVTLKLALQDDIINWPVSGTHAASPFRWDSL